MRAERGTSRRRGKDVERGDWRRECPRDRVTRVAKGRREPRDGGLREPHRRGDLELHARTVRDEDRRRFDVEPPGDRAEQQPEDRFGRVGMRERPRTIDEDLARRIV